MILLFSIPVLLLSLTISVLAQSEENPEESPAQSLNLHKWGAITIFHGLPSNYVRAIAQDREGLLWFGTESGLARYDGRRTQKIAVNDLPGESIYALKALDNGELWVGTDSGAARLVKGEVFPIKETRGQKIISISTNNSGQILITSKQGSIFTCSVKKAGLDVVALGPKDHPLLEGNPKDDNELPITGLIPTAEGLIISTFGRGLLTIKGQEVREILSRPREYLVTSLAQDNNGKLWFGIKTSDNESGLCNGGDLLHPERVGERTGRINTLCFTQQGELWVGTEKKGVFIFRNGIEIGKFTTESSKGGLLSNQIYTIFLDREGVIWFGTDRGVCRFDPNSPHTELLSTALNDKNNRRKNVIRSLYQNSAGQLWAGTSNGLFVREPNTSLWQTVESLTDKAVYTFEQDNNGYLIVGTASGLYTNRPPKEHKNENKIVNKDFIRIEKSNERLTESESIRQLCKFRGEIYLANYDQGVEKLVNGVRKRIWPAENEDPERRKVLSLCADGDNRLFIGTAMAGVFIYDGQQFTSEPAMDPLKDRAIWSMKAIANDQILLATANGLYRYQARTLTPLLKGYNVRSFATSAISNAIWCATEGSGLFKLSSDNIAGQTYARLAMENGLPSDRIFSLLMTKTADSEALWIGTTKGLTYYQPSQSAPLLRTARILGKRIYQPEELSDGLFLEFPHNSLALDVAAISSRTFPEQFQYLFLLLDSKGNTIRRQFSRDPQFLMNGLTAGRYHVQALAYSSDLISSQPLSFYFTVASAPFPWTTLSLSVLLALSLTALWWGYHQNVKLAKINNALATANHQVAETRLQLATETETERQRIARDLHDQTLSDLRHLLMLVDQLPASQNGHRDNTPTAKQLRNEIESVSTEIRRICEDLSPSVLTNVGLTAALEWAISVAIAHLPVEERFEYEFICNDDIEDQLDFDANIQIQIYRIVQEAINNICKHAGAKKVRLLVEINEERNFQVILEDDGKGFTVGKKTGRGLNNIRSRASMIEADVSWQARSGGGTRFKISKPTVPTIVPASPVG